MNNSNMYARNQRYNAHLNEGLQLKLDEHEWELSSLSWYPKDDTINPGSKRMFKMIDVTGMHPWRFFSQEVVSIGQYTGKSAFMYPGFTNPERITCNFGSIGPCGCGKSSSEKFFESSMHFGNLLNDKFFEHHNIDFDSTALPAIYNGATAKKIVQLVDQHHGQGMVLWADACM